MEKPFRLMELPKIGETYSYFDDGKLNPSRLYKVKITSIVPFDKTDEETLSKWKVEFDILQISEEHWLYAMETDYFVFGELMFANNSFERVVFVRTVEGGWFSLGWWGGRLDIDGSLYKIFEERWPNHNIN